MAITKASLKTWNYNVKLVFMFTFLQAIGSGIWMGNVLSSYIYLLSNSSNILLGLTSLAMGLTMTVVVLPAGYLADKFRRDWILRIAAILGACSLIVLLFSNTLRGIVISLVFWGLFQGFTRPALEAIFADSVPSGGRSKIYSWRNFIMQLAGATGPFLNVGLFWLLGDEWELSILKTVMIVGLIFSFISLISMLFFQDKMSLGADSESITYDQKSSNTDQIPSIADIQKIKSQSNKSKKKANGLISTLSIRNKKYIPYVLVGSNLIIGIGAGMTIKFFPIFFMEEYGMQPILVQLIMGMTSIMTGISVLIAQKFSKNKGRAQMIFAVQGLATVCLAIITFYPSIWILIPVFILRGSLMNSAQPLSRSILMDVVPKKNRGKWNSLETLAWGLFWNFSAAIGGYLIGDNNNFRRNFIVTTCIYVIGTLLITLLFPIVIREEIPIEEVITEENID